MEDFRASGPMRSFKKTSGDRVLRSMVLKAMVEIDRKHVRKWLKKENILLNSRNSDRFLNFLKFQGQKFVTDQKT